MALFTISKSWTALSLVSPAALRKPISLKVGHSIHFIPSCIEVINKKIGFQICQCFVSDLFQLVPINGAIGIKHASSKSDRIKELTINNLTKNLDLVS